MTMRGGHEWWKYVYDEHYNCIICPEYQPLACRTTNRDGYQEYDSDPKICAQCPYGSYAPVPMSGSLPMPRKSTVCAICFIEVWPKSPIR